MSGVVEKVIGSVERTGPGGTPGPLPGTGQDSLAAMGWDGDRDAAFAGYAASGLLPARVTVEHRGAYVVRTSTDDLDAQVSGRLRHAAVDQSDFPSVGDWVAVEAREDEGSATIHLVLERRSAFVRRAPGRGTGEQVLAANVDLALVVMALNRDFNLRRLERYLATAWDSGAAAAVVLSKADLADSVDRHASEVEAVAAGVPVYPVSVVDGRGLGALRAELQPGRTVAFLGSSGVGKSTLINAFAGSALLAVREIRPDDDRGRHTTTQRQLVRLPGGALVIDTPGLRELGLIETGGIDAAFADLEAIAAGCRFADCQHEREPGCAVHQAIARGDLPAARLGAHRKLVREARHAERERNPRARAEERRRWANISAQVHRHMRAKYGTE